MTDILIKPFVEEYNRYVRAYNARNSVLEKISSGAMELSEQLEHYLNGQPVINQLSLAIDDFNKPMLQEILTNSSSFIGDDEYQLLYDWCNS